MVEAGQEENHRMTRLLIAGATGLVGGLVLQQALADPRVSRVIALTRRPIAAHEKLDNVVLDFAEMPADAAWWSVDGVVSALGTTRAITSAPAAYRTIDVDYPLAVARHARAHGATRFALVSSLGADPRSRFAYTRSKGELESELAKLGFASLTIVRPSMLVGHRENERPNEGTITALFRWLGPVLPRKWRISPASVVAACLLEGAIAGPPGVHVKHNEDMEPA
jgi:uncharacterized protein YbjT (DUF2867 family)